MQETAAYFRYIYVQYLKLQTSAILIDAQAWPPSFGFLFYAVSGPPLPHLLARNRRLYLFADLLNDSVDNHRIHFLRQT